MVGDSQRPSATDRLGTWGAAILATLALAWLQGSFPGLFDLDSYFHSRAALDLAEHGVRKTFPQATFSIWAETYGDKDFLFHALTAPLVSEQTLVSGGKRAVVLFDLLLFLGVAYAIGGLRLRFGALWLLLIVATSAYYAMRLLPLRPHLVGLAFIAVEIALLARDRWRALLVVAALHVLAHSSFPLVFALWGVRFVVAVLLRSPLPIRSGLALACGIAVGLVVHPYFPNNLRVAYAQIFRLAGHLWGGADDIPAAAFGSELRPMTPQMLLRAAPGWLPALLGLVARAAVRGVRGWNTRDAFLLLTTMAFLALALASRRFLDMFVLSGVLLAGALWTTLADGRPLRTLASERPGLTFGSAAALLACLGGGLFVVGTTLPRQLQEQSYADVFRPAVEQLDVIAEEDDVVYHPTWREFSFLYAFRPNGRYISALDPVFLHERSPELFRKSWLLSRGISRSPRSILAGDFHARWIFVTTEPRFLAFRRMLARTAGIERVWASPVAEIWSVAPGAAPRG